MLDNEPDTNPTPEAPNPQASSPSTSAPTAPRRRRAASRPAGPPSPAAQPGPESAATVPEQPTIPEPAPTAAGVDPDTAAVAPAKKATRKRATKKVAATEPSPAGAGDSQAEVAPTGEPPTRLESPAEPAGTESSPTRPRKRASSRATADRPAGQTPTRRTRKTAAAAEPVLDPAPVDSELAGAPEPVTEAASPSVVAAELTVESDDSTGISAALDHLLEQVGSELAATDTGAVEDVSAAAVLDETETDQSEDASTADETDDETAEGDDDTDGTRRRRRRRGGRRRRRSGGDEAEADDTEGNDSASAEDSTPDQGEPSGSDSEDQDDDSGDGQRRRRRRRRRRGEDSGGGSADDPTEVVVRVREPRRAKKAVSNEVTGIEGSTRMEAKRQRRRDGRDAGRRRTPILSEAEFLARRESVSRKMIVRQREDLSQIAVLEDGILVEHYVDRDSAASLIGNVYLGRVQNVLPSMEAAFIDIGRGRNAVLYAGEVDWDSFGAEGQSRRVEKVLKSGQPILVQVSKDPVGAKGARLTNHVSIPGRYIVYAPGGHLSGISRKLADSERKRLRDILGDLVGDTASVIVRTAAEGASEDELVRDVNRLKAQWADIEHKVASGKAPQLLYGEPDLTVRIVRDLFTEDFSELIIAGNGGPNDAYDAVQGYVSHVAPHLQDRLVRWDGAGDGSATRDIFAEYRLDEQIAKAVERKVFLPSGGSLVIDRTEAMTVIDVNTGKFTGAGGNLEATVTSNNLEAAEEIVRQLRLRDIGGIIVIDFIDMVLPRNRELLLRRLVECLGRDRTRHQVAEVTSLGLVQMTRKKIGTGLLEAFTTECEHCHGRGVLLHDLPVESQRQADGGAREPRPREPRRGQGNRSEGGKSEPAPSSQGRGDQADHGRTEADRPESNGADDAAGESQESRPTRSRRGGRGRRSGSANGDGDSLSDASGDEAAAAAAQAVAPLPVG